MFLLLLKLIYNSILNNEGFSHPLEIINISNMLVNKKEQIEKEKKSLFVKDIVTKNPIFSKEHIEEFYNMFSLYCDAKRQCDIGDILNTAKTLGFEKKYSIVFNAIATIVDELNGTWIDFETFLSLLTDKIVIVI